MVHYDARFITHLFQPLAKPCQKCEGNGSDNCIVTPF